MSENQTNTVIVHGWICRLSTLSGPRYTCDVQVYAGGVVLEGVCRYFNRLSPPAHVFKDVPLSVPLVESQLETNNSGHGVVLEVEIGPVGTGPIKVRIIDSCGLADLKHHARQPTADTRYGYQSPPATQV